MIGMTSHHHHARSSLCASAKPNRLLATSATLGWTALLLDDHEGAGVSDVFETRATPDLTLVVATSGAHRIEVLKRGCWHPAVYQPGAAGMTPPGQTTRMRWSGLRRGEPFRTAHLYLPGGLVGETAEEYRRLGTRLPGQPLDALVFRDRAVAQCVSTLLTALRVAAPRLYVEQTARWLATHLLSSHAGWRRDQDDDRHPGMIGDRRLTRVIEHMSARLHEDLSVADLAREAGISVHHFGRVFRRETGRTPAAYLLALRMDLARRLLRTSDLPVADIATACGYGRSAAFAAAFARHCAMAPTIYRRRSRSIA